MASIEGRNESQLSDHDIHSWYDGVDSGRSFDSSMIYVLIDIIHSLIRHMSSPVTLENLVKGMDQFTTTTERMVMTRRESIQVHSKVTATIVLATRSIHC